MYLWQKWTVLYCELYIYVNVYIYLQYMIFDRFVRDPAPQFPAKLVRGCAMYGGNDLVLNDGVPHSLWTYLSQISFLKISPITSHSQHNFLDKLCSWPSEAKGTFCSSFLFCEFFFNCIAFICKILRLKMLINH